MDCIIYFFYITNIEFLHFANKGKKNGLLVAYKITKNSSVSPHMNQQINLVYYHFFFKFRLTIIKLPYLPFF